MARNANEIINVEKLSSGFASALIAVDQALETGKEDYTWLTRAESYAEHLQRNQFSKAVIPALPVMPITTPKILEISRSHHLTHLTAVLEQALGKPEPATA